MLWRNVGAAEHGAIGVAGVLAAAVAVMNQAWRRLPVADRVLQGIEHERLGHLLGQAPADDAARTEIEHQSQIGKGRFFQRDVGDVGDPHAIELRGRRRPLKEVGTVAQRVPTVGGLGLEGLRLNGLQTLDFQQFCHAIDAARLASGLQFDGDPAGAVASFVLPEDVADEGHQFTIPLFSRGFRLQTARRSNRRG